MNYDFVHELSYFTGKIAGNNLFEAASNLENSGSTALWLICCIHKLRKSLRWLDDPDIFVALLFMLGTFI